MKRIHAKRLISFCLSILLVLSLAIPAIAAEVAKGTDLRLESTEGTVAVTNANGRSVSIREGMKLYSGYTITTEAASYAYISLDDDKVVKLDASSEVEIRKQGKKLEVLVKAGELFFNVTKPVSGGQTLNVRTSTMVTGIRGTSGYVSVISATRSTITILDGFVSVSTPNTGRYQDFETVTVSAGITGIVTDRVADEHWHVTFEELVSEDIPGYVLTEMQKDEELSERVAEDTALPVAELAATAEERLQADQEAAAETQAAVEQDIAAADQVSSSDAPPFQKDEAVTVPDVPVTPDTPSTPDTNTPSDPGTGTTPPSGGSGTITLVLKVAELNTETALPLDAEKTYTITVEGPTGTTSHQITVPAGASESQPLEITGLAEGQYMIRENAPTGDTLTYGGLLYNYYKYTVKSDPTTIAAGSTEHSVTVTNYYERQTTLTVTEAISGTQLNSYLASYDTVIIAGDYDAGLTVANNEAVTIASGKTVQIESDFTNEGTIVNNGTFINNAYI